MVKKSDNFLLSVVLVFLALVIGTQIHDPLLHSIIIWINNWQLGDWQSGILTGSTEALISISSMNDIPTMNLWIFYMFPAITIFTLIYLLTMRSTSRFVLIAGTVIMALNIASFSPSITGSDANSALNLLILRGWSNLSAYLLMYGMFLFALILYGIYIYIAIENNPSDARKRLNRSMGINNRIYK